MKKLITLRVVAIASGLFLSCGIASAQLTLGASPYTENFDGVGSGLPTGWTVRTGATASALGSAQTLTTATSAWAGTGTGFRNSASADSPSASGDVPATQAGRTDRVIGVRQGGSFGDPGAAFVLEIANTTGLSNFDLTFKLQSLDIGSPRTTTWVVDYGFGATPTSFTAATTAPASITTGNSAFTNQTVTVDFGTVLDNNAGPVWIRIAARPASTGSGNRPTSAVDDFSLTYTSGTNTSVQFATTGSTVNENAGTVDLTLEITDEDATIDTEVDVVLITGAPGRVNTYTTQTVTFLGGSSANEDLTITITDNSLCDGNTVIGFELQNITGGQGTAFIGTNDTYDLTINDNDVCTGVQFASTGSTVNEGDGTVDLTLEITDEDATIDTEVDVVLITGAPGRVNTYTTQTVTFLGGSSANEDLTITITDNTLCDGNTVIGFELQNITGGQGTAFIGTNDSYDLGVTDNDAATAPVAQAASAVGENVFTAEWDAVSGATGYELDVYSIAGVVDDFSDDDFTADLVWAGSTSDYAVLNSNPSGAASTDGFFLASNASVGNSALYTASAQVSEWKFSWASPSFSPSSTNHFGVVLMADASFTSIADAFDGYYLRIGVSSSPDPVELWRSTATTKTKVGDFSTPNYDGAALTNGINVRVTRSASGVFEFFYGTGFTYASTPTTSGGTLTDATHSTSTYFGVYTGFANTSTTRRIYLDNVDLSGVEYVLENEDVGAVLEFDVTGLDPATTYFYVVRANVGGGCGLSANSNEIEVTTDTPIVPELFSTEASLDFGFVLENGISATQEFDVNGTNLDPVAGDITVALGAGLEYELSLDEVTWDTDLLLPYTGGALAATTVYVRFIPTTTVLQAGNITISGGGANDDVLVALSGTGNISQIYWNFETAEPTVDLVPDVTTSVIALGNNNGTSTLLSSTASSSAYAGASGANNAGAATQNGALNTNTSTRFTWSHTPASGTAVRITDISFGSRSTGTGPAAYSIRSSADGYTNEIASGTLSTSSTWELNEHNGLNVVGGLDVPLTFRIYGYNGSGAVSNTVVWRIDDLDIRGEAITPAAAYYSRSNGNVTDAIWATTPAGTAGSAVWSPTASMIVQVGDTITVNSNTNVDDLTLETTSRLNVGNERLMSVHGSSVVLAQNSVGSGNGEVELVSTDAVTVTVNGLVTFNNLTLNTPAGTAVTGTLDIRGTLLLADGDFDATGGTVRLRSNATRTGHLGPVGATAEYLGDLTTQRFIPEGVTNWRLLGSAVDGRTVADWDDDFITAGFPGSNYPTFDQPQGSGILWPSVRVYDETDNGTEVLDGLNGVTDISQALTPGQGFAVWCGDALGGTAAFLVEVVGEPTIARTPLSLPVSYTDTSTPAADGWNLVSNPLPSAVAFASLTRGTDLFDGYYIYDPVSGSSANWDADLQISTPVGVLDGVIQSSQAFWLKAGGSDVATSVLEANKVSDNSGGVFGGVADGAPNVPLIRLTIAGSASSWSDEAAIAFVPGTPALDVKDALKLDFAHASAPRIATRTSDGYDLIVNKYGTGLGNITIPVTVRAPINGTYSITVSISGMDALTCFTLEDLLTGTVTPVTDGTVVSFDLEATSTIVADRFILRSSTALPYSASAALCGGTATGQVAVQVSEGPVDLTLMDAFGNAIQQASNVAAGEFIFDELVAGNYTVSVGNGSACGTVLAPVVVLEPFALEAGINTLASTCGTEADGRVEVSILGGQAPYTYLWNTGSTGESISGVSGTYSVLVTDASGCTLDVQTAIPAGPVPEALFESTATTVLVNEPVAFTNLSSLGLEMVWDFGDGTFSNEENATHSYALPGTYTVLLTVSNGTCEATFSQEIVVQISTSAVTPSEEPGVLNAWNAGDQLIVEHSFNDGKPVLIDVLDATGRLHLQKQFAGTAGRITIPSATLSTGIWFVRVSSGKVQGTFRVPVIR